MYSVFHPSKVEVNLKDIVCVNSCLNVTVKLA